MFSHFLSLNISLKNLPLSWNFVSVLLCLSNNVCLTKQSSFLLQSSYNFVLAFAEVLLKITRMSILTWRSLSLVSKKTLPHPFSTQDWFKAFFFVMGRKWRHVHRGQGWQQYIILNTKQAWKWGKGESKIAHTSVTSFMYDLITNERVSTYSK